MPDNLELFQFSLKHPEPIIDPFYLKNGNLIISEDPSKQTQIMRMNAELLETISAYSFGMKKGNAIAKKQAIETILKIVKAKNINYSEFISFWPVVDISYSLFEKLNPREQFQIIQHITEKYIELRHALYSCYGYTPTTLQVGKDAKAHKESGALGNRKVSALLDKLGFKKSNHEPMEDFFPPGDKKYIEADKKGKKLFKLLLPIRAIKFIWSKKHDGKMPDFLIKSDDRIFIVEHKHMKEGGGGQDKQMNEVISFTEYSEDDSHVHYVSFLDGLYANLLADEQKLRKGKVTTQKENIEKNLKRNKQSYFVNTAGFKKLMKILVETS